MKRHAFVATFVACVLSLTLLTTTSAAQDTTSKKPLVSIDPLGMTTRPGGKGTNFVLEGAATLNLGAGLGRVRTVAVT